MKPTDEELRKKAIDLWESIPDFRDHDAEIGIDLIQKALNEIRNRSFKFGCEKSAEICRRHNKQGCDDLVEAHNEIESLLPPPSEGKKCKDKNCSCNEGSKNGD